MATPPFVSIVISGRHTNKRMLPFTVRVRGMALRERNVYLLTPEATLDKAVFKTLFFRKDDASQVEASFHNYPEGILVAFGRADEGRGLIRPYYPPTLLDPFATDVHPLTVTSVTWNGQVRLPDSENAGQLLRSDLFAIPASLPIAKIDVPEFHALVVFKFSILLQLADLESHAKCNMTRQAEANAHCKPLTRCVCDDYDASKVAQALMNEIKVLDDKINAVPRRYV